MPYIKTIVCLANSYKYPNGRCIAGREARANGYGGWIRPISARETAELSFAEYHYADYQSPRLLDIVQVPLLRAEPHLHQTENHIINTGQWAKTGTLPWDELEQLRDRPASLWINSDHTRHGFFDCMSAEEAATLDSSLLLIKRKTFIVEVGASTWNGQTKRTYRGKFEYNGTPHNFSLTDPAVRDVFKTKPEGEYSLNDVYVCISLTEAYREDGRCHKLVAAVFSERPLS